jgi:polyisoprenoid-binding protein YceI
VRLRRLAKLRLAFVGQLGVGDTGVAGARRSLDVARALGPVEQARDSGCGQEDALREVDAAQPPALRAREVKQHLVVVEGKAVLRDELAVEAPRRGGVRAQQPDPGCDLRGDALRCLRAQYLTPTEVIPAGTWVVDAVHTTIGFQVTDTTDLISTITGRFTQFEGRLEGGEQPSLAGTIRVASLRTDNEQRDAHLVSGDFLDAANYPEIRFESTAVEPLGDERFRFRGNLFVEEQPFEVELEGRIRGRGRGKAGDDRLLLDARGSFDWGTTTVEVSAAVSAVKEA